MTKEGPAVLVIDDDEVMLVAIADLLEAAQFRVSCHASPAGAADIAAGQQDLAAVVLDLNMPIMRGDNVARMFMSRASLRDLPIVLLSGDAPSALNAVRAKMPNVRVVSKAEMESALVPAVREAIAERTQRTRRRAWGSEPSGTDDAQSAEDAHQSFYRRLAVQMEESREPWREIFRGKRQGLAQLIVAARALHGEADRLTLPQVGELLRGLEQIASALQQGAKPRPSIEASIQRAVDTLCVVAKTQGAGAKFTMEANIDGLRHALLDLRGRLGSD